MFYIKKNMNFLSLVLLLVMGSNDVSCQDITNLLQGRWILKQVELQEIYECPDVIVFNKNKSYQILNDCYSKDGRNPVIEKGVWEYNVERKIIVISDRKFYIDFSNHYVHRSKDNSLLIYVRELKNNILLLCFESEVDCKEEKYIKIVE